MKEIDIRSGEKPCYTYTCKNTYPDPHGALAVPRYCSECQSMLSSHETACKEIGVQPWDETFVLFRAGVFVGRKQAEQPAKAEQQVDLAYEIEEAINVWLDFNPDRYLEVDEYRANLVARIIERAELLSIHLAKASTKPPT